jgi:hypothetical protein
VRAFSSQVVSGALGGVLAVVLVAVFGLWQQDRIEVWLSQSFPDCGNTSGLQAVDVASAIGPESEHPADDAVDGYFGTIWIPPLKPDPDHNHRAVYLDDPAQRTIELHLADSADVRLVCVNNGLGHDPVAYSNYGKVRNIEVWTDRDSQHRRTTLPVLPDNEFQGMVDAATRLGDAKVVYLQLVDSYIGVTAETFDPDACNVEAEHAKPLDGETPELRFDRGCINAPAPEAGLSEITVFTEAE